ncbi:integral membrane regulatory protein [Flexivirga endophytica]|uniref:Integral membrane regulatory protein n=1 Tax=Flexivirga endophytica TaxID=1849103 RepID=A0A916TCN4_9MICO|nr:glycosyltransferase [Flexivirga endophytica]GGB39002.1 integral membrane regulatory protein [Flexivirga endophytica]GHB46968.1 integral membrane regulatory protein [Flexivirga endophytica]
MATDDDAVELAVTALLVVQHSDHPRLLETLDALVASDHRPDRLIVIDATPGRDLPGLLAEHPAVGDADWSLSVVTVPAGTPFAEIVDTAVTALPDPGEDAVVALRPRRRARKRPVRPRDRDVWLWLLHEDSAPDSDALSQLVSVVSGSDRIGIAGCKVLDSDNPTRLVNVGIDLTRTGRHVGSRMQGEPDQGQHDDRRDVLGVSSAGMLIRRDVYLGLGGFDPAFDGDGDGLDVSWRAHLIGRQVIVVPAARAHQDLVGKDSDVDRPAPRSPRTLRRHRQVALARCSLLGLPFMALWILLSCTVLGLLMLLLKRPRRSLAEFAQASAPLGVVRIIGARWRFIGRASTRRRNLRNIFVPWRGAIDHATATIGDAITPEPTRRDIPATAPVETGPVADDAESMPTPVAGRTGVLRNPGLWVVLGLLATAAVCWRDLITGGALRGTGNGLTGGALQPFTTDASGVWRMWRDAWTGPGLGQAGSATPYLVVLAPLAWIAQQLPGVHGAASASAVVTWLLVLAMPLSGLVAYRAGRIATHARWPRVAAALAWATLPTLTTAVAGGRLGPVVAHIVFPFAFAGVFEIGRRRASTPVTFGTVLAAAVVGAFAPALLIVISLVALGVVVLGPGWARLRGLTVAVLPWLVLGWWTRNLLSDWRALFAGPGGLDTLHDHPAWQLLLLHPGGPGSYAVLASAPVLVFGIAGLVRSGFGKASTGLALVGLLGLATGLAAGHLHLVQWSDGTRTPWAGLGLDVFAAALIAAGLVGLRGLLAERSARAPRFVHRFAVGVTATACVLFAGIAGLVAWQAQPTTALRPAPAGPPSVVASQLTGPNAVRLLHLSISDTGAITYRLTGRETGLPATGLHQPAPSGGGQAATAATALLEPDQADAVAAELRALAVGFVIVDGPGERAAVTDTLHGVAGLTQISRAARAAVWRVDPAVTSGGGTVVASSRVWLERDGVPVDSLPSTVAHARSHTRLPAGPAGRDLVLAEGAGWRDHGTVAVDGHRVQPVVSDGRLRYPMPAGGGRLVIDPGVQHRNIALGQGALAALLLFLAIPLGNRRSRRTL